MTKFKFLCLLVIPLAVLLTGADNDDFKMMPQGFDSGNIDNITVSPDGKYFAYIQDIYKVKLWSIEGKLIKTITLPQVGMAGLCFSGDSRNLLISYRTNIVMYDMNGMPVRKLRKDGAEDYPNFYGVPAISPDNNIIACGIFDNVNYQNFYGVCLYDFNFKEIARLKGFSGMITRCVISPDNQIIAVMSYDKNLNLYDMKGNLIRSISGYSAFEHQLFFTPDSKLIVSGDYSTLKFVNTSGILLKSMDISLSGMSTAVTSDLKYQLNRAYDQQGQFIKISDLNTGKEIRRIGNVPSTVLYIKITPSNKHIICSLQNGLIRIYNLDSFEGMTLAAKENEWICYTDDGYFDCSMNGNNIVAMVKGMDASGVDQFALKYNRPDLILKRMALGSEEQIAYYKYQHEKRLKKFNLTEEKLSAQFEKPEVKILDIKTADKTAKVKFQLSDAKYKIAAYNIFVNDVQIFPAGGKKVSSNNAVIEESIEMTAGENKIEISCVNEAGTEAIRGLTYAKYTGKTKSDLYFIGFGVSQYKDKDLNLKYADKDVKDLEKLFKEMKNEYNNINTKIFVNQEVTIDNIRKSKEFLKNAKVDDSFILFIAGHGVHDTDADKTYYFLTYETDLKNLSRTSAPFELIEDLLYDINPRNKLFLMDTCESGEVDEGMQKSVLYLAETRGIKARGLKLAGGDKQTADNQNKKIPRRFLNEKDRYIFNDLRRRSGAIVFSSSMGGEYSYEKDDFENGLFTEQIINCFMKKNSDKNGDGYISIDELREYVIIEVSGVSDNLQHPTVDRDNIYQKFGFPLVK